jgi:hypothetical protein
MREILIGVSACLPGERRLATSRETIRLVGAAIGSVSSGPRAEITPPPCGAGPSIKLVLYGATCRTSVRDRHHHVARGDRRSAARHHRRERDKAHRDPTARAAQSGTQPPMRVKGSQAAAHLPRDGRACLVDRRRRCSGCTDRARQASRHAQDGLDGSQGCGTVGSRHAVRSISRPTSTSRVRRSRVTYGACASRTRGSTKAVARSSRRSAAPASALVNYARFACATCGCTPPAARTSVFLMPKLKPGSARCRSALTYSKRSSLMSMRSAA